MPTTFISKTGAAADAGVIVLWYGSKNDIPDGWVYYSAAAGYWVMGASSAVTVPANTADHSHGYSQDTGEAGYHTHPYSPTIGPPINETTPGYWTAGTKNAKWANRYHTNHSKNIGVSNAPNHVHGILTTGLASSKPPSIGLYYIRKG